MKGALLALGLLASACSSCPGTPERRDAGPSADWLHGRPSGDPAGPALEGGDFVVRIPVEPRGLSRIFDAQAEGTMVRLTQATVYETLARPAAVPGGELEPVLAQSWALTDDHRALTVHLRPGILFHDGSTLDAEDLLAVLRLVANPDAGTAALRGGLGPIEAVTALDPLTVQVRWSRPDVYGVHTLLGAVPLMPSGALAGDPATLAIHRSPIGTGPFRFEAWLPGERLSFLRWERWWGGRAHLARVEFRVVRDDVVAVELWRRGEFDLMTRIPADVWRALERPEPANAWAWTSTRRLKWFDANQGWIGWNLRRPPLDDARVRKALALAWPAATVARVVELGLERRTTCPYALGTPSCDSTVFPLPLDPAGARALLDEAGWRDTDGDGLRDREGRPLRLTFLSAAGSQRQTRALPLYQEQLRAVGVDLRIEVADPATVVARMKAHDFDAVMMAWSSLDEVIDAAPVLGSAQADEGANTAGFRDARVDALLEQARATFEDGPRHELERQVHRLVFEAQPYLLLSVRPNLDAVNTQVHGLRQAGGWYELSHAWKER